MAEWWHVPPGRENQRPGTPCALAPLISRGDLSFTEDLLALIAKADVEQTMRLTAGFGEAVLIYLCWQSLGESATYAEIAAELRSMQARREEVQRCSGQSLPWPAGPHSPS